jgi:hypothetical protein
MGTILEILPKMKKGIRKALKDKVNGSQGRTAKSVEKGRGQRIKPIKGMPHSKVKVASFCQKPIF